MGTHDSGKVDLVMVACVAREVTMIVEPALFYRVNRIHLLNYVKEDDESEAGQKRAQLYREIRDTVCRRLDDSGVEVVMHDELPTYIFSNMMKEVYSILQDERSRDSIVYVNISGGTYEYAAAASIAAMMTEGVKLFNVGARNSIESAEDLRRMLTKDGNLVGTTDSVYDPFGIQGCRIESPDIRRLEALRIFAGVELRKRSNTEVIRRLIIEGVWNWPPAEDESERIRGTSMELFDISRNEPRRSMGEKYRRLSNSEKVRYQKDFIDRWKANGWIEQVEGSRSRKYDLTEEGRMQLRMFCPGWKG